MGPLPLSHDRFIHPSPSLAPESFYNVVLYESDSSEHSWVNAGPPAGISEALKWLLSMLFSLSQEYEHGDTLFLNPVHAHRGLGNGCPRPTANL
ncbi:unnamed protein product [Gulo gulo]|uniref:Uncharacterized protein n=1 Tax=Gulo gulo TaxID=48420 RepID=A0A9X9Q3X2_GULGU|nr:unnamed protein product [Gulo gulo]